MVEPIAIARAIGWSCLGFTVASVVAPRALARAMGHGERPGLVRALGARDLVIGAGLAVAADPTPWLRARLASEVGDAVLHAAGAATGRFHTGRALTITAGATLLAGIEVALLRAGLD